MNDYEKETHCVYCIDSCCCQRCLLCAVAEQSIRYAHTPSLRLHNRRIAVSLATTEEARNRGLGGVTTLERNQGMLFVFDDTGNHFFWMKDMLIPIDILWIDDAWNVVHIEHNVSPESYPKTFGSPLPARYVLEVAAGVAQQSGVRAGDTVDADGVIRFLPR